MHLCSFRSAILWKTSDPPPYAPGRGRSTGRETGAGRPGSTGSRRQTCGRPSHGTCGAVVHVVRGAGLAGLKQSGRGDPQRQAVFQQNFRGTEEAEAVGDTDLRLGQLPSAHGESGLGCCSRHPLVLRTLRHAPTAHPLAWRCRKTMCSRRCRRRSSLSTSPCAVLLWIAVQGCREHIGSVKVRPLAATASFQFDSADCIQCTWVPS